MMTQGTFFVVTDEAFTNAPELLEFDIDGERPVKSEAVSLASDIVEDALLDNESDDEATRYVYEVTVKRAAKVTLAKKLTVTK